VGLFFIVSGIKKNSSWRAVFGVFLLVLSFILFFSVGQAHAFIDDWTYNFDSGYNNGNLSGQNSWTSSTIPQIQSTISQTASKAIKFPATSDTSHDVDRMSLTSLLGYADVYFRVYIYRHDDDTNDDAWLNFHVSTSGFGNVCGVKFEKDVDGNDIQLIAGGSLYDTGTQHVDDTWYQIDLHLNNTADTCQIAVNGGSWSTAQSNGNPGTITGMYLIRQQSGTQNRNFYIDSIYTDSVPIDENPWSGDGTQNLSEIQITQPTVGSTTASKTFNYAITGALDSAFAPDYVDRITVSFCSLTVPEDDCQYDTPFLEGTDFNWDSSFNLTGSMTVDNSALYLMTASFVGEECDFWLFCEDRVYKADMVQFMVASTTATAEEIIDALQGPQAVLNACEDEDAGWVSALTGGALCKVLTFLFYPSTPSWSKATSTIQLLKSRAPFGYFYQLKTGYENITLTASTTPTLTLVLPASVGGNLTILSEANIKLYMGDTTFNLLYSFVELVLWVLFGFYIFRRVSGLANNVSSK